MCNLISAGHVTTYNLECIYLIHDEGKKNIIKAKREEKWGKHFL